MEFQETIAKLDEALRIMEDERRGDRFALFNHHGGSAECSGQILVAVWARQWMGKPKVINEQMARKACDKAINQKRLMEPTDFSHILDWLVAHNLDHMVDYSDALVEFVRPRICMNQGSWAAGNLRYSFSPASIVASCHVLNKPALFAVIYQITGLKEEGMDFDLQDEIDESCKKRLQEMMGALGSDPDDVNAEEEDESHDYALLNELGGDTDDAFRRAEARLAELEQERLKSQRRAEQRRKLGLSDETPKKPVAVEGGDPGRVAAPRFGLAGQVETRRKRREEELQEQITALEQEITDRQRKYEELKATNETLEERSRDLTNQVKMATDETEIARRKLADAEELVKQKAQSDSEQVAAFKNKLEEAQAARDGAERRVRDLEVEATNNQERLNKATANYDELKADYEALQKKFDDARTQITTLEQSLADAEEEQANLEEQVATYKKQMEELRKRTKKTSSKKSSGGQKKSQGR
jgi:predicted  nucleic acid-binding Zn-ribbon protein